MTMIIKSLRLAASALLLTATAAHAQPTPAAPPVHATAHISLSAAQQLIEQGLQQARGQSQNLSLAVVDRAGHLVALTRMDKAALVTIDVAIGKARSAAYLNAPSKKFEDYINAGQSAMVTTPNVLPLQGGVPLVHQGQIVGAIGVSGASGAQDEALAQSLATAFAR
ncbi:heme-binding protein [Ottowia sp.]|uniref:GlcG/HbpS family heme-binding protein n=1 Tax=Ottowia sp. TaxID=1898956 RepID=UPI002C0B996F|nr:heme-binding protein [Ottowia sp.]HOB66100.1 heme-binding protein [Ottowia sp.]HPZ58490.1 heme-binding protein [Ottowia sp.]HQD48043.1 heme-binding protein [Ottowia sp.]